jgi:ribonuclease T2
MASLARLLAYVGLLLLLAGPTGLSAQDRRQSEPGQFDFYVLTLSWSPTFCESASERGSSRNTEQCGDRPYAFVVHGLWPQHERGFPAYCQVPAPRLDRNIVGSMLDIMPAPRLVFHEWDRHGTCTGLSARAYFDMVRKAREMIKIPDRYVEVKDALMVSPSEVEEAFIDSNPQLTRGAVAVTCDSRRLRDIRVCLTKDLAFRNCPEIDRRACGRDRVLMPPVRVPLGAAPTRAASYR